MDALKITISALWAARMLTGFLGDVLRFFEPGILEQIMAGDVDGMPLTHGMLFVAAVVMVLPIVMVFLSLILKRRANRWANIALGLFFITFDLVGLPTYHSAYGIFLILVGIAFCGLIVWYAWRWPSVEVAR